jgi:hypothetical protein
MARGQTIFECIHGATPSTVEVLDIWNTSLIYKMLDAVWKAYDDLHGSSWPGVQWHESFDDLERSLTEQFAEAIRRNMDSNMPVYAEHKPAERESRSAPPAAPPEYDIAFKLRSDCRIMWPL